MEQRQARATQLRGSLPAASARRARFYDLRAPETRAELARAHGIHGFFYYYWFNGRRLLHRPLDEVVQSGQPDFPFCVCWANENWTRRWDGGNDELLVAQKYSPESER